MGLLMKQQAARAAAAVVGLLPLNKASVCPKGRCFHVSVVAYVEDGWGEQAVLMVANSGAWLALNSDLKSDLDLGLKWP